MATAENGQERWVEASNEPTTNGIEPVQTRYEPPSGPVRLPRTIRAYQDPEKVRPEGRTIVVCLDGTGDKFDSDNSNIVHLVTALKKDDVNQVTYYQAGIGTYGRGGLSGGFTAAVDMAVGSELGLHVRDAYEYLMHTFKEGDRICLFGFSRGAYTARCLAGMIHKVGLLPPRNVQQIPFAYEFYKDDSPEGWKASGEFKKAFCIDVNCYFIGIFDSVSSVGIFPRTLPLSSTPTNKARFFRHAMALDERRSKFKPLRFTSKNWSDVEQGTLTLGTKLQKRNTDLNKQAYESEFMSGEEAFETDFKEVWFLGAHADVGGGAVKNEVRHKLANIPLRWLVRQCFECNTGIRFQAKALAEIGLDVHMLWPKYIPLTVPTMQKPSETVIEHFERGLPPKSERSKHLKAIDHEPHGGGHYDLAIHELENDDSNPEWLPEQIEDWCDAMSPINDQLIDAKGWWILELWPVQSKWQKADSEDWEFVTGPNLGRYRAVDDKIAHFHWTVKSRMEHLQYQIQARIGRSMQIQAVA